MKSSPILLAILFCFAWKAQAQTEVTDTTVVAAGQVTEIKNQWSLGTHVMYGLPLCELKEGKYRNGLAWDLEVLTPSLLHKESPLQLKFGGHFDYLFSGREKVEITVQDPANAKANDIIRNSSFGLHLMGRLALKERTITPYLDGIIGGRLFLSDEVIRLKDSNSDYEPFQQNIHTKATFIYGGSLGALYKIGEGTYLDFRVTYSHGSRATYVNLDSYQKVGDTPIYNTNITKSPILFVQLGLVANISKGDGSGSYNNGGYNGGYNNGGGSRPRVNQPKRTVQPRNPSSSPKVTPKVPSSRS